AIVKKGAPLGTLNIAKGNINKLELTAERQYSVLLKKGNAAGQLRHEVILDNLKAPIAKGDPIGKLIVYSNDQAIEEFVLTSPVDIHKAGWWTLMKRTMSKAFFLE